MKLNATAEMMPVTWPEFGELHPFAPADQARGYAELFARPRSLARRDHRLRRRSRSSPTPARRASTPAFSRSAATTRAAAQGSRDVCLIPVSAHGTNPASAAMAGFKVVAVACDAKGNVEIADLEQKADAARGGAGRPHGDLPLDPRRLRGGDPGDLRDRPRRRRPGVHGRREHERAGRPHPPRRHRRRRLPPEPAQDVLHPPRRRRAGHGTDRRGRASRALSARASRIARAVRRARVRSRPRPTGAPASCPSPGSTSRSWAPDGLAKATVGRDPERQLHGAAARRRTTRCSTPAPTAAWPTSSSSTRGRFKKSAGVEVDDIAKRLMDYGFHAPTMSFPVPGTLMIEPTESESKAELDRFCDAHDRDPRRDPGRSRKAGRTRGQPAQARAPHRRGRDRGEWTGPISREQAAFPAPWVREHKFWPTVARIDNAYGDRNLVCTCPPMDSYGA